MWIVVASTCCPSAPASAASTSELSLQQAERLASSVTLSGKLSPPRSWRLAWKKKPWLRLLSGATCEHSTAARGVELWIASLAATRASPSASPVSGVERMIRGTFGRASLESLRRLNPHCVSSRTSAGTYHSGSTLFGTSFKDWATELRLDFSRRQKLARRTGGSGCSSWPTVRVEDAESCGQHPGATDALNKTAEQWTTPQCHDTNPRGAGNRSNPSGGGACLAWDAQTWSTPRTSDTNGAGKHGTGGVDLRTQAGSWPTPGANDHKGSAKDGQRRGQLDEAAEQQWPTPASTMTAGEDLRSTWKPGEKPTREDGKVLQTALTTCTQIWARPSLPDQATESSGSGSSESAPTSRPRLNPAFVEWLMGWPEGWTDFGPVGMGWFHWRRRMRSCLFGLVCGSDGAGRQ